MTNDPVDDTNQQDESVADEVTALKDQLAELENKWKRALADYQNLERRIEKQQQEFVKFANATLIQKLLPVLDDLSRAAEHVKDDGVAMVKNQLWNTLEEVGVEQIETEGKRFDPAEMEAVERVPGEKEMVTAELQAGYRLHSSVLRPAQVEVGDGTEADDEDE